MTKSRPLKADSDVAAKICFRHRRRRHRRHFRLKDSQNSQNSMYESDEFEESCEICESSHIFLETKNSLMPIHKIAYNVPSTTYTKG